MQLPTSKEYFIKNYMKVFLFILIQSFALNIYALNKFSIKIIFPKGVDLKNVMLTYNNGYNEVEVDFDKTSNTVTISDTLFSKYAVISVYDRFYNYYQQFFIKSENAIIKFVNQPGATFVNNFLLTKAISIDDMGRKYLLKTANSELKKRDDFIRKYVDFSKQPDSINNIINELENKLRIKQYEFIKANNKTYYSLWLFKSNFVDPSYYPAEKLFAFYNKNLKNNITGKFESSQIETILNARIIKLVGKKAPLFISKAEGGEIIRLSDFKGKFVLIDFWAPWCSPCIAEMPVFNKIYSSCSANLIKIISVNCDDNIEDFKKALQKNNMTWINIFKDKDLINKYGKKRSLPQVYLINPEGLIIYSRDESKDLDLSKLQKHLSSVCQP